MGRVLYCVNSPRKKQAIWLGRVSYNLSNPPILPPKPLWRMPCGPQFNPPQSPCPWIEGKHLFRRKNKGIFGWNVSNPSFKCCTKQNVIIYTRQYFWYYLSLIRIAYPNYILIFSALAEWNNILKVLKHQPDPSLRFYTSLTVNYLFVSDRAVSVQFANFMKGHMWRAWSWASRWLGLAWAWISTYDFWYNTKNPRNIWPLKVFQR